jgi:hypothetical protein
MAYQGEYFVERYGKGAGEQTPPIKRILEAGVKISAGTDATRVASYDPWVSLAWLVTGKTLGGLQLYPRRNRLDRETALRMWTENVTWFSNEEGNKGNIKLGQLADLAVLDRDYFQVPENEIQHLQSVLTIVDGKPVYGAEEFATLAPPPPPAMPDWSPVRTFGGYQKQPVAQARQLPSTCGCDHGCAVHGHDHAHAWAGSAPVSDDRAFWAPSAAAAGRFEVEYENQNSRVLWQLAQGLLESAAAQHCRIRCDRCRRRGNKASPQRPAAADLRWGFGS